jgi:hypothetical protein
MMMSGRQRGAAWTSGKYHQKLQNLSRVLLEIGSSENTNSPTFIGCSEIENRGVLEDLIKESNWSIKMELFILILPISGVRVYLTVSKEIFPLQQYTFDRISKEPTKVNEISRGQ